MSSHYHLNFQVNSRDANENFAEKLKANGSKVAAMSKQLILMLMVLIDALLGLLFVYSSFSLWDHLNLWVDMGYGEAIWSPLVITVDTGMLFRYEIPNSPFILFWVVLAVNLFFIIMLGRNKETKQRT